MLITCEDFPGMIVQYVFSDLGGVVVDQVGEQVPLVQDVRADLSGVEPAQLVCHSAPSQTELPARPGPSHVRTAILDV